MAILSWCPLDATHLGAVEALHRRAIGALKPEVVKPEHADFFAGILGGRGRVIGMFEDGRLLAYGVLQHVLPASDDPRPALGLPDTVLRVKLAGASVEPDARGRGLQRALIAARVQLAREAFAGREIMLYATSAPGNGASWSNLLAEGFEIRALKLYYGGYPRYVMVHGGGGTGRGGEMILDPGDLEGQERLLAQGWRGVRAARGADGTRIVYAAPPTAHGTAR